MDPTILLNGIFIGFLAASPIGAVAVMCVQRTINRGFFPGLMIGFGSAFGDFFYAIIAGFGISIISDFLVAHRIILGIIGGLLMIFLGCKIFTTNPAKQIREQKSKSYKNKYFNDFMSSFALTISNPLTIIVFGGLFAASGAVSAQSSFLHTTITLCGVIIGALAWWLLLTSVVNIFRKKITLRKILWINRITGICVFIFGISVMIIVIFFNNRL